MTREKPRISLVTGAAAGLGRVTAVTLAARGDVVIAADRDEGGGRETVAQIARSGGSAEFCAMDVTCARSVEDAIATTVARHGRLDCAVNNAGVEGATGPLAGYAVEEWDRVISVNLRGVFLSMKFELAQMARQRHGAIVNVGSTASLGGVAGMPAYAASKHGLVGLTKTAALDYADQGVRVNAICPGSFRTAMSERLFGADLDKIMTETTPMGRLGSVEEIAQAIAFLCSDGASFITGVALPVEGGKRAR